MLKYSTMQYQVLYCLYICGVFIKYLYKMILEKDKNIVLVTHLSGFGSYLFPLGSIVIPFIIRETKKDDVNLWMS